MTINESIGMLQRLYLEQIINGIKLRVIASNGSTREEVETLKAEARRIEADIYPVARNLCERNLGEFADIARLGAYRAFISSANEKEAEMAKRDYGNILKQMQARQHHQRK